MTEPLASVDLGRKRLVVNAEEVTLGSTTLALRAITGVRYGGYVHTTKIQGVLPVRDHARFTVWLTDGRQTLEIECAGMLSGTATAEARLQAVVAAIWNPVVARISALMLTAFRDGHGFVVAGTDTPWWKLRSQVNVTHDSTVRFDHQGLHQTHPQHEDLAWSQFGGHHVTNGEVILFKVGHEPSWRDTLAGHVGWASFSLRQTWNAVCLDQVLKQLAVEGYGPRG